MLFTTDKQTLDDLNIFGKQNAGTIYSLFHRTATVKGAALLEELFRYPLSHANAINERSSIIASLSRHQTTFPFAAELMDSAEQYLANTDERSRLSAQPTSLATRLNNLVAEDAAYKVIHNGVIAIITILQTLHAFIHKSPPADSPYHTAKDTQRIRQLLQEGYLMPVLQEDVCNGWTREKTVQYDRLLRFQQLAAMQQILQYIYTLDVYTAVARVAAERGFAFPYALPGPEQHTEIEGMYHPQLKNAVTNSLHLTPASNVIFLTGANMAGKSTFMKTLGTNLYLAHMGFPVAASRLEFTVLDGIYTTINLPDNLGMGASHFYAEVLRVKKIAKELSVPKNILVIFDELFRGTNVKDAYEATIELTAAFAQKRNSVFVISTHIIEAGDVLKERCPNISFQYLPTILNGTIPQYTYQLTNGITADRHGMMIIHNEGILEILDNGIGKTA